MKKNYTFFARGVVIMIAMLLLSLPIWAQSSVVDPSFPPVQATGMQSGSVVPATISDIVRQADGKYIIVGDFTAINGVPASRIARLELNGTVDLAFTAACAADGAVRSLVLLPDGRILVGGRFTTLAGSTHVYIGRLLPSGAIDPTFAPYSSISTTNSGVHKIVLQPNGQVLVCGSFNMRGASFSTQYIVRLNGSDGQYDSSFQFTLPTPDTFPHTILLQPDGNVLVGADGPSYRRAYMLMRLQSNGAADANFSPLESTFTSELNAVALDAVGRIYAGGSFQNGPGNSFLRRYLPNGTVDGSFAYPRTFSSLPFLRPVKSLAVQPNGRVLVAQSAAERVQPNGSFDTGFTAGIGGNIRRFLVQPDGAIMIAGVGLTGAGPASGIGLVRVLDANVLTVKPSLSDARTTAWPVPAHETLNLHLDAESRPHRVQLLDALGRPVLTLDQPTATLTLPVAGLAAGTYHVQVEYAKANRVTRRVVLY